MLESELVKGLISKDIEAFNEFIEIYSVDILKSISYILKEPQDRTYIEECFDDVVMQVLNKSHSFKSECPLRNWVMCIAKNKALDYKRKIKKYYNDIELNEQISLNESAEDEYLNKCVSYEIDELVNKLEQSEKTLFIKKYILDISTKELCEFYNISENVLYKRLSRLRKKLKVLFDNRNLREDKCYE